MKQFLEGKVKSVVMTEKEGEASELCAKHFRESGMIEILSVRLPWMVIAGIRA